MKTYRFQTTPTVQLFFGSRPGPLTPQGLAETIVGATVRDFVSYAAGQHEIEVQLDRHSHEAALTEIAEGLALWGLDVTQAVVTEWVTSAAEGVVGGALGGFSLFGLSTDDLLSAGLGAVIGMALGAIAGSLRASVAAQFDACRYHPWAPWVLTPRALPPQQRLGFAW